MRVLLFLLVFWEYIGIKGRRKKVTNPNEASACALHEVIWDRVHQKSGYIVFEYIRGNLIRISPVFIRE